MVYKVIKEETCPTCEGKFSNIEEVNSGIDGKTRPTIVLCLDCTEGVVRTEVLLTTAIREIIRTDPSFILSTKLPRLK